MAPASVAPQKAMTHSGRLRMTMATRSPGAIPKVERSRCARVQAMR